MEAMELYGFCTAMAICPVKCKQTQILESVFGEEAELSISDTDRFFQILGQLTSELDRSFNEEEGIQQDINFPEDTESLADWCTGFMTAHFLAEEQWFVRHEQEVSELLLPVMLASGLFDDEPDFLEMLRDEKLVDDMVTQIPEVLLELYLLFHTTDEK